MKHEESQPSERPDRGAPGDPWEAAFGNAVREAFPGRSPAPEEKARILQRVRQRAARRSQRRATWLPPLRFRLSFAAVTALLLILAFVVLQPREVDAGLLDRVVAAMAQFRSGHLVFLRLNDQGQWEYERQLWYREGSWRTEMDGDTWIYTPRATWRQKLPDPRWVRRPEKSNFGRDLSGLAPTVLGGDFEKWGRETQIRYLEAPDGPPGSFQVVVEPEGEKERILLAIDQATSVPRYFEFHSLRGGRWHITHRVQIELGLPLSPALFAPGAPAPEQSPARLD